LRLKPELAGRLAKCPDCGEKVRVQPAPTKRRGTRGDARRPKREKTAAKKSVRKKSRFGIPAIALGVVTVLLLAWLLPTFLTTSNDADQSLSTSETNDDIDATNEPGEPASTSTQGSSVEARETNIDAAAVPDDPAEAVKRCIAAISGGSVDRGTLQGKIKTVFIVGPGFGGFEQFKAVFGTDSVTIDTQFELPDMARAAIGVDGKEAHLVAIGNATEMWIGNQSGMGETFGKSSPPSQEQQQQQYAAARMATGIARLIVNPATRVAGLAENQNKVEFEESPPPSPGTFVLTQRMGQTGAVRLHCTFDSKTFLPIRIEDRAAFPEGNRFVRLVNEFSGWKQFGELPLPAEMTATKAESTLIYHFKLLEADFDSSLAPGLFTLPK